MIPFLGVKWYDMRKKEDKQKNNSKHIINKLIDFLSKVVL